MEECRHPFSQWDQHILFCSDCGIRLNTNQENTMEIKLGQLFLLRRDIKKDISTLNAERMSLLHYRDDQESNADEFKRVDEELQTLRDKLFFYDLAIEEANSKRSTVLFKDVDYSLNEARHLKVHLQAEEQSLNSLIIQLSRIPKTVKEQVWEPSDPSNPLSQQISKQIEHKNIVNADIKERKAKMKQIQGDVQLLDSLIQQLDWSTVVEVVAL